MFNFFNYHYFLYRCLFCGYFLFLTSNENLVHDDLFFSKIKNYELNYTAKQLGVIYEYYNLGNPNKLKKIETAQIIVAFEHDKDNMEVVERRKTLWFYMTELKSVPFTKKYVWSP